MTTLAAKDGAVCGECGPVEAGTRMHRDPVEGHTRCCDCTCGGVCEDPPLCDDEYDNKDAHTWEPIGTWATGGTGMSHRSRCRDCGAELSRYTTGSQRNPGECDVWRISYGDIDGAEHCDACGEDMAESDCPECNSGDYCPDCKEPWEDCYCGDYCPDCKEPWEDCYCGDYCPDCKEPCEACYCGDYCPDCKEPWEDCYCGDYDEDDED